MAGKVKTYNPKEVNIAIGTHIVTGYAEDSFVSIEPSGDGTTKKIGADGEVTRSKPTAGAVPGVHRSAEREAGHHF